MREALHCRPPPPTVLHDLHHVRGRVWVRVRVRVRTTRARVSGRVKTRARARARGGVRV